MRLLDLFSGIGGFSLAARMAGGFETVMFCEIEPFCRAVLAKHWPGVPCHDDIRTISAESVPGPIDLICGGFPCQDVSCAGKGRGIEHGERSGLWREMFRLIRELLPRWVLAENVPALRTRGADLVVSNLEAAGYAVWPLVVGAWAVGAPHKRDRLWIVGQSSSKRRKEPGQSQSRPLPATEASGGTVGHADMRDDQRGTEPYCPAGAGRPPRDQPTWPGFPAGRGAEQYTWEAPRVHRFKRGVGAPADGLSERLVRLTDRAGERIARWGNKAILRAAGNSIVPQVAAEILRRIREVEEAPR